MARRIDPQDPGNRGPGRGSCYLYVLPCSGEDILKLGFSRDPVGRIQALHPRWFEFFDLDAAFLVEAETVRDARDMELGLGRCVSEHSAPAPLVVRREAGGHTEWYRGAYEPLRAAADALGAGGYVLHAPLRTWIQRALLERADLLFSWAQAMLGPDELDLPRCESPNQRTVRDALDAHAALAIDLESRLPANVLEWHREVVGRPG